MLANNIAIESCLTSNFQTGTVTDLSNHPIRTFLDKGLLVCLNTDDPAVENIELKHEYQLAKNVLNFNEEEFTQLQKNSLAASFLSEQDKVNLLSAKQ
jgi:adenosine deaminase